MKVTLSTTEVQEAVRDYLRDKGLEPDAKATVASDGTYSAEVTKYVVPIQAPDKDPFPAKGLGSLVSQGIGGLDSNA